LIIRNKTAMQVQETRRKKLFVILLRLLAGSVATKAPIRNSQARDVGEKKEDVGNRYDEIR
jgi:hypothetical protein